MGQDLVQGEEGGPGGRAPDAGARTRGDGVALQGVEGRSMRTGHQAAGVSQAHLVGGEQQDRARPRPLAQPPEPLGEGRAVGGVALPHDGHRAPVREREGRIHGHGAVPAEADRVVKVGDPGGEAVDGGRGVEPLQEDAPPVRGEGPRAQQFVHAQALLVGEAAQARGGEGVAPRRGDELRGVGKGCGQPLLLQRRDAPVDRAPRPAGEGDQLQPVEEGYGSKQP